MADYPLDLIEDNLTYEDPGPQIRDLRPILVIFAMLGLVFVLALVGAFFVAKFWTPAPPSVDPITTVG